MSKILTIYIPTYNRCEYVLKNVQYLIKHEVHKIEGVKIHVSDNSSDDNTYDVLRNHTQGTGIVISKNDSNLGFQGNFLKAFKKTDTEYVLITSDEDFIEVKSIQSYLRYLSSMRPTFVSPQARISNKIYRGKENNQNISPSEWRAASFYISGTTYNIHEAKKIATKYEVHLAHELQYYPQCIILSIMLAKHQKCLWYAHPMTNKYVQLPTKIDKSESFGSYHQLCSRWQQHILVDNFFSKLIDTNYMDNHFHDVIKDIQSWHRESLFSHFSHAIKKEYPNLHKGFVNGAKKQLFAKNNLVSRISKKIKKIAVKR